MITDFPTDFALHPDKKVRAALGYEAGSAVIHRVGPSDGHMDIFIL